MRTVSWWTSMVILAAVAGPRPVLAMEAQDAAATQSVVLELAEALELHPNDVLVAATAVVRVQPDDSRRLRAEGIEGVAVVRSVVRRNGKVSDVRLVRATYPELGAATVRQFRQWRFRPATVNGKPVATYFTLTQKYELQR